MNVVLIVYADVYKGFPHHAGINVFLDSVTLSKQFAHTSTLQTTQNEGSSHLRNISLSFRRGAG